MSEIEEIAFTQLVRFDPRGEELIHGKIGEACVLVNSAQERARRVE